MKPYYMCKDWHNSEWWHRCRDYVKSRYGWKCCLCGCVSESVEVDHVLPYDNKRYSEDRKREMFSAVGNMWVLCPRCHRQKTKVFDGLLISKAYGLGAVPHVKGKIKKTLTE